MQDLFELFSGWYADVRRLKTDRLVQLLTLGAKAQKISKMKDRILSGSGERRSITEHDAE